MPAEFELDCPWTCQPTQTCDELGLACGAHPECPDQSCGSCELGYTCEDGQCVTCTPDCTDLECGPDPVCGLSCGTCDGGLVCEEGSCVEAPALSCHNPGTLVCDGSEAGDTTTGSNDITLYGACQSWQYAENEHVYEVGPFDAAATVTATLSGLAVDLDLFLLADSCDGDSCLDSSAEFDLADEVLSFQAEAGVTYYLAVDGSGTGCRRLHAQRRLRRALRARL